MLKRWGSILSVGVVALTALAACGGQTGGGGETQPVTRVPVISSPAAAETEAAGQTTTGTTETAASPASETTGATTGGTTETAATPAETTGAATSAAGGGMATPATGGMATQAEGGAASPVAGGGGEVAQGVTVISKDIYFEPKEFSIPANTDVKVTLKNEGAAPHNFAIDALKISQDQQPGETHEITINAPAGEYEYYCNVPGHKEAGMVGKLTVK